MISIDFLRFLFPNQPFLLIIFRKHNFWVIFESFFYAISSLKSTISMKIFRETDIFIRFHCKNDHFNHIPSVLDNCDCDNLKRSFALVASCSCPIVMYSSCNDSLICWMLFVITYAILGSSNDRVHFRSEFRSDFRSYFRWRLYEVRAATYEHLVISGLIRGNVK